MKKPLHVGNRIREVLAIADNRGKVTAANVRAGLSGNDMGCANTVHLCQRAVALGLLTCDRTTYPMTFSPAPGWRERLPAKVGDVSRYIEDMPDIAEHHLTADETVKSAMRQPNSVFAMASRPDVKTRWANNTYAL